MEDEMIQARDIKHELHFVRKADMEFRISVYGVVISGKDVLLVPQWDGFDIPGGGIKIGEGLEEALTREVFEETGIHVQPDVEHVLHVMHDLFVHPTDGKPYHYVLLYFPCEPVGGQLSDAYFEPDERQYAQVARWVPIAEVDGLRFYNPADSPRIIKAGERLMIARSAE